MKGLLCSTVAMMVVASLLVGGCAPSAPPPAPTSAPAPAVQPTKPAAPTAAPAAAPTKAPTAAPAPPPTAIPAPKVAFPEKGKAVTIIVPWAAGGASDVEIRTIAPYMEKELGTPIQIVNRAGATGQIGITEAVRAKADGYTLVVVLLPATSTIYMDPERKSVFARKDLATVAAYADDPFMVITSAKRPWRDMKDFVDTAKANPDSVKMVDGGIGTASHLGHLLTQQVAGIKYTIVHMTGDGDSIPAILGGHVDGSITGAGAMLDHVKSGEMRILGVLHHQPSPFVEGKTAESQGYKIYMSTLRGLCAPAGTPKEVVNILAQAVKKSVENPECKKKLLDAAKPVIYMGPDEYGTFWDNLDKNTMPSLMKILLER